MKYRAIGLVFYAWVRVSIQVSLDRTGYDVRTHHTNMDTFERVRETDLKQARCGDGVVRLSRGDAAREAPADQTVKENAWRRNHIP